MAALRPSLLFLAAIAALALSLTGCGGGDDVTTTAAPSPTSVTSTSTSAPDANERFGLVVHANATAGGDHPTLVVAKGSVVDFTGDALVNAANKACLGGGGVDGAITKAGGDCLAQERQALPELSTGVRCPTGDAKVVDGCGELKVQKVILAVGPNFHDTEASTAESLLTSAYAASLARAGENDVATVAFPPISAGIYKGDRSLEDVLRLGMAELYAAESRVVKEVYIVAFDDTELTAMLNVLKGLKPVVVL